MGMQLAIIFFSLLPVLIYSFVIYLTVPYKTIKFKEALPYIVVGFLSVGLLEAFWDMYPEWHNVTTNIMGPPIINPLKYFHVYYFVQVALIEELAKLSIFILFERVRSRFKKTPDHPLSTMFFVGMVSLGFAVIENIHYGSMSPDPMDTLWWRSITAVIGHMVFGLFMGYWISMGRMGARFYDRSLFDIIINKRKRLRNIIYTFIGLIAATILHGIYDLHIELNGPVGLTTLYMLLIMSLLGVFWCFKNLNKLYNKKVEYIRKKVDL